MAWMLAQIFIIGLQPLLFRAVADYKDFVAAPSTIRARCLRRTQALRYQMNGHHLRVKDAMLMLSIRKELWMEPSSRSAEVIAALKGRTAQKGELTNVM